MDKEKFNTLMDNVYKHPILTCMVISSICGSIATLVNAFKK